MQRSKQQPRMPYPLLLASQRRVLNATRKSNALKGAVGRSFSSRPQEIETFLSGTSSLYAEQMLEQYEQDPNSVHPSWKQYFDNLQEGVAFNQEDYSRPTIVPGKRQVAKAAVSRLLPLCLKKRSPRNANCHAHIATLPFVASFLHLSSYTSTV